MRASIVIAAVLAHACDEAEELQWPEAYDCSGARSPEFNFLTSFRAAWEVSGPSRLLDVATQYEDGGGPPMLLGVANVPVELAHVPVEVDGETLFLGRLYSEGRAYPNVLLTGGEMIRGAVLPRLAFRLWTAVTVRGDVIVRGRFDPYPVDLPEAEASVMLLSVGLAWSDGGVDVYPTVKVIGDLDPSRLRMSVGPDGGLVLAGVAASTVSVGQFVVAAPLEVRANEPASELGHAWIATFDRRGIPTSLTMFDGDAGSSITGTAVLDDDRVVVVGRFGGVGARSVRFGQASNVPTLVSVSGGEVDTFDGFVAVMDAAGVIQHASRIRSASDGDGDAITAGAISGVPGGFVTHVVTARGDTVYGEGQPGEVRITAPTSRARWVAGADGLRPMWAKATDDYRMVGPYQGQRTTSMADGEYWSVLRLDDDGAIEESWTGQVVPATDGPVFEEAAMMCWRPTWLFGGSVRGKPSFPFSQTDLELEYDIAEPHIVVVAAE